MTETASSRRWGQLRAALQDAGLGAALEVPLAPATTYQVGGAARCATAVRSAEDVGALAEVLCTRRDIDVLLVGRGSNLLVSDAGFEGLAVFLGSHARLPGSDVDADAEGTAGARRADEIEIAGSLVVATGWTSLPVLARRTVAARRCGLQWAVGVPGTVGGAVRMNAGGHGSDIEASLVSTKIVSLRSGRSADIAARDLGLHFRGSALADHHLVVSASFETGEALDDACERELAEIVAWRRANQPGGRNAGSVFVNPAPGEGSAGALIDAAGLRGMRHGGAEVSDKHANFIQADPGATAADVVELMSKVQDKVRAAHGVTLRSEVRLVGFAPSVHERFADKRHDEPDRIVARTRLARLLGDDPGPRGID